MKKTFLIISSIILFNSVFSQDVILLKNGDEIKSKVTEIEVATILYKRFDNLNGPTYSIPKSEVFMIRYENGTKEVYNTAEEHKTQPNKNEDVKADNQPQPTQHKASSSKYRKEIVGGALMTGIGVPSLATGGVMLMLGSIYSNTYDYATDPFGEDGTSYFVSGTILLVAGTALTIAGPIQLSKGIRHKRQSKQGSAYLNFTPISGKYSDTHFQSVKVQKVLSVTLNF